MPQTTKEQHYHEIDHYHCWEEKNPPCGQKIEHLKCCLCEKLNPKATYEKGVSDAMERILSGMKPYTIKADDSVRMADFTHTQFEQIVRDETFWRDDEKE